MERKRVAILIDGGNFHHLAIKKLRVTEIDFDFERFALFLATDNDLVQEWKRYYTGTVREKEGDPHSKDSMARQTRLFTELKRFHWLLRTTKLKTRLETIAVDSRMMDYEKLKKIGISEVTYERKREKGVDVMLTTDLIVGAVEDTYDMAVIISSDADLLPAIDWVRKTKGKHIQYVGFSFPNESNPEKAVRPLPSLIKNSDTQRVLVESDLRQFIKAAQ